jgi:PKD domain
VSDQPGYPPEDPYQQRQLQMAASAPPPPDGGEPPPASPPAASFTYSPPAPGRNQNVTFDASGSQAGDAPITDYGWLFNGTVQADGVTATWQTPNKAGSYFVVLTVTAEDSQEDTASQTITVP